MQYLFYAQFKKIFKFIEILFEKYLLQNNANMPSSQFEREFNQK